MVFLVVAGLLLAALAAALWYVTRKSRWYWKLSAAVAVAALACISALTVLLFSVGGAMCGRYNFPPVSSADGRLVAQVSEEDCGATDSFHSSVQLWRGKRRISTLLGKRDNSTTIFTIGHDPRLVELEWKGTKTLLIRYPNDSRSLDEFAVNRSGTMLRLSA